MPETLPATATVTASSIDCTVAVLKVPTPTMQMPQACNLQSLGIIMEPNNINIELNPAATTPSLKSPANGSLSLLAVTHFCSVRCVIKLRTRKCQTFAGLPVRIVFTLELSPEPLRQKLWLLLRMLLLLLLLLLLLSLLLLLLWSPHFSCFSACNLVSGVGEGAGRQHEKGETVCRLIQMT